MYVVHVTEDGIELIKPHVITETHVIINTYRKNVQTMFMTILDIN